MEKVAFEALVGRLDIECRNSPGIYRLKLLWLAILGYAFIFAILGTLLFLILFCLYLPFTVRGSEYGVVKGISVLIPLAFMLLRALWISIPPPDGIPISPKQSPLLFQLAEELRQCFHTPNLDGIILNGDFNAGIVQCPGYFLLWPRNYLILGFPILASLSMQSIKAVLGHEFAHLSGSHGWFSAWIYRIRNTWFKIMANLEAEQLWGSFIFRKFFNWYAPAFGAYSFVLAREHEFEADRQGSFFAGADNSGETLIQVTIQQAYLSDVFWESVLNEAKTCATPPDQIFHKMLVFLAEPIPGEMAERWMKLACKQKTTVDDTHPSLQDRLSALGLTPKLPDPSAEKAVRIFFGPETLNRLSDYLSQDWVKQITPQWNSVHGECQAQQKQLTDYETVLKERDLTCEEEAQKAICVDRLKGGEAAFPIYQNLLGRDPLNPSANFGFGRILLEKGDENGIGFLEKAMNEEPDCIIDACQTIVRFLSEHERDNEAQPYISRMENQFEILQKDQQERSHIPFEEIYDSHGLPEPVVKGFSNSLEQFPELEEAYLVRKKLSACPHRPLYVLGIKMKAPPWYSFSSGLETRGAELSQELCEKLSFPGQTSVLNLHGHNQPLLQILQKVPSSLIFKRN